MPLELRCESKGVARVETSGRRAERIGHRGALPLFERGVEAEYFHSLALWRTCIGVLLPCRAEEILQMARCQLFGRVDIEQCRMLSKRAHVLHRPVGGAF